MDKGRCPKICAFCTSSVAYKITRVGAVGILDQFYKEFISNSGGGDGGGSFKKRGEGTGVPENWVVCTGCLPSVQGVLGRKERVNRVEREVRRLQGQLLKELRGLAREVAGMCEEMRVVEGIMVIGGTEMKGEGGGEEEGGRALRRRGRESVEDAELIGAFREKVGNVLRYMEDCNATTSDKLLITPDLESFAGIKTKVTKSSSGSRKTASSKVRIRYKKTFGGYRKKKSVKKTTTAAIPATKETVSAPSEENVIKEEPQEIPETEDDIHDNQMEPFMEHLGEDFASSPLPNSPEHFDEDDGGPAMEPEVAVPVTNDKLEKKIQKRPVQKMKKLIDPGGDDDDKLEGNERMGKRQVKKRLKLIDPAEEDSDLEDTDPSSTEEDFSDEDFDPDDLAARNARTPGRYLKFKSIYRRNLITLLQEHGRASTSRHIPSSRTDPRRPYYIRYDNLKDKFFLDEIEVTCLDAEQRLECSKCLASFQDRPRQSVIDLIYDHILGRHLDAYQCPHCPTLLRAFAGYQSHTSGHEEKITCDICAKPLLTRESLKMHKWLHLNEAEKADPANASMMPHRIRKPDLWNAKRFQCTICGKAFKRRAVLKYHEEIHKNPEEREKVMCPDCGVIMIKGSMKSHVKSCANRKPKGVNCPVCEKRIKNVKTLQVHLVRDHPDVRTYSCTICGKGFKIKPQLRHHMQIHSEERKFVCRFCGKGFKQKNNLDRHEKVTCGGGGGGGGDGGERAGGRRKDEQAGNTDTVKTESGGGGDVVVGSSGSSSHDPGRLAFHYQQQYM